MTMSPGRSAVGRVELAGVGREAEALAPGEDPAVAELGDGPLRGAGSPDRSRGSNRSAAVAFEYAPQVGRPEDRRPGRRARARASSPDGPARRGARPGRRGPRSPTKTASAGSVLGAPAVRTRSTGSGPRRESRRARSRRPRHRPRRSRSRRWSSRAPRPWPGRSPRTARARSRGRDSLTMTPTRPAMNGATQTSGWVPKSARRTPGLDDRGLDDVGRHLDARHEVAALDDLAVEDREDLERIEPVEALELARSGR